MKDRIGPDGLTGAERDGLPPAVRNRKWRAALDAVSGRVVADCDRLDARNYDGDLLERDTGDLGDRTAIAEYGQAVRAASDHNPDVLARIRAGGRINNEAEYDLVTKAIADQAVARHEAGRSA